MLAPFPHQGRHSGVFTIMSSAELIAVLPFARRYARALTGSQGAGDAIVARALTGKSEDLPARLALYACITRLTGQTPPAATSDALQIIERQLLLLTSLEEMTLTDAARVVGLDEASAAAHLARARAALKAAAVTDVLIIEDEPIIAMELQMLLEGCGHRIAGIAASEAAALRLVAKTRPGLILADINLGRGGSGIAAVSRILDVVRMPVIFVTAFPEMLLTAEGIEPAYVMRKPFDPMALAIFAYQAITAGRVPLH
jgi:CheY-like chemotaxis protein